MTNFTTMVRWTFAQVGPMLPLIAIIQAVMAAGMIIGFGFLIPDIDPATALFLATGAQAVMLMMVGLVILPQGVATARNNGTFTYLRTLPVPRAIVLGADMTVWVAVALPSLAVGALVAWWYYGLTFDFEWLILIPAALLVTIMATAVGYALAVTFAPMVAQALTQVLIFFIMLFSPITYPASQLPTWLQNVHQFLPFESGANLVRAGLAAGSYSWEIRDLVVLGIWTLVGLVLSLRALTRRA